MDCGARASARARQGVLVQLHLPYISPTSPLYLPYISPVAPLLERVKAELLREDEACFVLFRTRTWALISFTPPDAPGPECALYDTSCVKLQALLGGESRVPNVRRWASLAD